MPGPRKTKTTLHELQARRNFAMAVQFFKPLVPVLRKYDEEHKKGFNKAVSHIIRNAIQGNHPDQRIDYSKVVLGEGSLSNPRKYEVVSPAKGLLEFTWTFERLKRSLSKFDRIFTVAYCETLNQCQYELSGPERHERKFLMDISRFSGQRVEVYFGFASPSGLTISTSVYAGSIGVL